MNPLTEMSDRELIRHLVQQKQIQKDSYAAIKDIEEEMKIRYKRDIEAIRNSNDRQLTLKKLEGE